MSGLENAAPSAVVSGVDPHLQRAFEALDSDTDERRGDAFFFLAEVIATNSVQNFRSDIAEARKVKWDDATAQFVQSNLVQWLRKQPDHPQAVSALWALGKFHDPTLAPLFREWLGHYIKQIEPSLAPLGQLLICLENSEERCVSGNSFAADEHGKNLEDALRYLKRLPQ